jgi:assimilatory nitrate reductase catalytic subunit
MAHTPEPRLAIHPADAAAIGLVAGGLARVETEAGAVMLRAELSHAQRRGELFAPMHWTDQFAASGPVGRAIIASTDPHSGQPALKSSPATIHPVAERLHGLVLRREAGPLPPALHWVRMPVENGQVYRFSSQTTLPVGDALRTLLHALVPEAAGYDWLDIYDPGRQTVRAAAFDAGTLRAALFLAPEPDRLPRAEAIIALLGQKIAATDRTMLLAGRAGSGAIEDSPRICACFGVSRAAIRHAAVTHGLHTTADLGRHLHAGTNCGSCIPELEEILRDVRAPAA